MKIEIAATIDVGEAFVKKTYSLEGDGPLAVVAYDYIIELQNHMRLLHMQNVIRIANEMAGPGQRALAQQYNNFAWQCVQPGLEYFQNIFESVDNLSQPLSCFKAARLYPTRVNDIHQKAADVRELANFPFIYDNDVDGLILELPQYLAASSGVHATDILDWWKRHKEALPRWSREAAKICLCKPSSAAAERVFSLLKASFSNQQQSELEDYIETSLMLQYNGR